MHAAIEEEIFYPAMQRVRSARSLIGQARGEHGEVKALLAEIVRRAPSDETIATLVQDLKRAVLHHATEEERVMSAGRLAQSMCRMAPP